MSVGPVGSPITADAIAAATRGKERADVPCDRRRRSHRRARAGLRSRARSRPAHSAARRSGRRKASRPSRCITSSSRGRSLGEQVARRLHQAPVRDPAEPRGRNGVRGQDREAGHRQGCGRDRASRRRGLSRRRAEDLLRPLQRPVVLGPDGDVGARLGLRRSAELQQGGRPRPQAPRRSSGCWRSPSRRATPTRSRRSTTCRRRSTTSRPT